MSAQVSDAPPRALPASVIAAQGQQGLVSARGVASASKSSSGSARGNGSSSSRPQTQLTLFEAQPRGVVGPTAAARAASIGGVLGGEVSDGAGGGGSSSFPFSSLSAHAAFVSSLAAAPPSLLATRAHAHPATPILLKEHSAVYVRPDAFNSQQQKGVRDDDAYMLRPNFRTLQESSNPAAHSSLNTVHHLPSSLRAAAPAAHALPATASGFGGILSSRRQPQQAQQQQQQQTGPRHGQQLFFVREVRRGGAAGDAARRAQEAKQSADDYEAGGLRPRPIKSVAAIMADQQQSGAAGAGASPKPAHMRLSSLDGGAKLSVAPSRFAKGHLAKGGAGSQLPWASADSDDEGEERKESFRLGTDSPRSAQRAAMLDRDGLLYASTPSSRGRVAGGAGGFVPEPLGLSSSSDDLLAGGRPAGGAAGAGGTGSVVVAAGAAGSSCCICATTDFVEPWISECAHICCSECWITWLQENVEHKCCPECEAPLTLEDLRPIALCPICSAIPTQPWTAPCHHTACRDCWQVWLAENPVCSECGQPVDKKMLPP